MEDLRMDYKDDILDTAQNTNRKYRMVDNGDGTVSFVDMTAYSQHGDSFGAADVNKIAAAINETNSNLSELSNGKFVSMELTPVTNTYAELFSDGCCAYGKSGMCHVQMIVKGLSSYSGWAHIATLPVVPEIEDDIYGVAIDNHDRYGTISRVGTDGKVYIIPRGTAQSLYYVSMVFAYKEPN